MGMSPSIWAPSSKIQLNLSRMEGRGVKEERLAKEETFDRRKKHFILTFLKE